MNIKNVCIKVNDFMAYIVLAVVLVTSAMVCLTAGIFTGLLVGVGGLVLCSLIFGAWFAVSGMYYESVKQTILLEKLSKHIS